MASIIFSKIKDKFEWCVEKINEKAPFLSPKNIKFIFLGVVIFLVLISVFSCNMGAKTNLNADNFYEYFSVNIYSENLEKDTGILGNAVATCVLHVEIAPLSKLKTKDVTVVLKLENSWSINGKDIIEITLPKNGHVDKKYNAEYMSLLSNYYTTPKASVGVVTGKIIK